MVEISDANSRKDKEERKEEVQPFIQAPQRESVIVFSTGKKLLRAPCFAQREGSAHQEQISQFSSELGKVLPAHDETPCVSKPTCQITPSVLHRGNTDTCPLIVCVTASHVHQIVTVYKRALFPSQNLMFRRRVC